MSVSQLPSEGIYIYAFVNFYHFLHVNFAWCQTHDLMFELQESARKYQKPIYKKYCLQYSHFVKK